MEDRYRKNDSGSLIILNNPHFHDTSKYNCLKEDNMTNDWTLYAKDGGRVEIYSISPFGDDLQLSRFPPFENVRHARWGHSNQQVAGGPLWWKFHEGRMWSPARPHKENKKEKKRFRSTIHFIHLLVFTQGVLLAKSPMQSLQNVRL